jgi:hypothetical protein
MASAIDTRQVQLPAALFHSLLSAVVADRSLPDAVDLLRQAGYDAGAELHAQLLEWIERSEAVGSLESLPVPRFWSGFTAFWESLGWGGLQHREAHEAVTELTSPDWAEADAVPNRLGCQVTTGLIADLLSRVAGQDVAVIEVECRGRGDARCRFLIGAPATLSALHGQLLEGRSPEVVLAHLT